MQATAQRQSRLVRSHPSAATQSCASGRLESATAHLLTQGGDARIELGASGVNQYGCGPRPDPGLVSFASSTASVISEAGFQAAVNLYTRLQAKPSSHAQELERQRQDINVLSGASRVPGTRVVLAASGADIHLLATHLATQNDATALQAVMVEPSETGSGVPAAMGAAHFGDKTSQGYRVDPGCNATGTSAVAPACVRVRHADGTLRATATVDAAFAEQVSRIVRAGKRCLLVVTDLTKTGLQAPSAACAAQLQKIYPTQLDVLVDACQFRLSSTTICAYLEQGCMVAITGSKFVGGPAFCGALLIPPKMARQFETRSLAGLHHYSCRLDWPLGWPAAADLAANPNVGLMLRWEAALSELKSFKAVPDRQTQGILQAWAKAVADRIASDPAFEALPVAPITRLDSHSPDAWDSIQTIFPFLIYKQTGTGARQVLSTSETALLYRQLRESPGSAWAVADTPADHATRFQLGQPVPCGQREGTPVSAMRICASARLVLESVANRENGDTTIAVTAKALQAFDKLAALVQRLPA